MNFKKLKAGMFLIDDINIVYKVVDVLSNSAIVTPIEDIKCNFACEVMSFDSMKNEGWQILKLI